MKQLYFLAFLLMFSASARATIFTVNSLAAGSSGSGSSGTLEYCIEQANLSAGPHTIEFSVAGTITISSNADYLPALTSSEIIIDGTTAPGYVDEPVIIIDHTGTTVGHGLVINGSSCEIYALEVRAAAYNGIEIASSSGDVTIEACVVRDSGYDGIEIDGASTNFLIENRVGVTADGTTCAPNGYNGIDIHNNSGGNELIDNHIACNGYDGLNLDNVHNSIIQGNIIGPLVGNCTSNGYNGIDVRGGSSSNIIGGTAYGEANKIAGNLYWGIRVHETGTVGNLISGNSISCNDYDGIEVAAPGNNGIAAPVITTANATIVSGTGASNAEVEVFRSHDPTTFNCPGTPQNQGADYLGTTTADGSGNWSLTGTFDGFLVATQRQLMNSSEFSNAFDTGVTPSWTNDCDGEVIYPVVPPTADFSMSTDSICAGSCVDFTDLSSDNPDTWSWTFTGAETTVSSDEDPTGICYLTAGTYQVSLTASNTAGSDAVQYDLVVLPLPVATISQSGSILIASAGFSSYQWLKDGSALTGENNDSLDITDNGNYEVVVTDQYGCSDTSQVIAVTDLGIANPAQGLGMKLYPNPATESVNLFINIDLTIGANMRIIDQLGRIVVSQQITQQSTLLDASTMSSGIYLVVIDYDGWQVTRKLEVRK